MDKVAAGRINVLIRRNPTAPLPAPANDVADSLPLPDQSLLIAEAVNRRPDVSAAAARAQAEQAKWALACKEYYPDFEVFGRYDKFWQPTGTQGDLQTQLGLRMNVPINCGRRNAAVAEAIHEFSKACAEYDQLLLDAQSEVQTAYEQVRESNRILQLYSQTLIPAAEQNVAVARTNYDVAKIDFLDLATAQRQLVDARDRQVQAQIESQRRFATLKRVAGGTLPVAPPAPPAESHSK
jgi:outer membrane protein TolC